MNYIIYSDGAFEIGINGNKTLSDCKIISHYKNTCEQIRRSKNWKSSTEHVFEDSFMISSDHFFEPRIHGVATNGGSDFYYALELENGGGIYKKSKLSVSDDEGFVFTSNDIIPQHISCFGNRLVCSMQYPDLTKHIVMFISERPDYYELTAGESVDEHPFIFNEDIYFSTCGIRRDENGIPSFGNRGIAKYNIPSQTVTELCSSDEYEYLLPKVDRFGNLYCIRKPIQKESGSNALINLITAPFWIFAGIVGFICAFTRIFTGKQLMGKSNTDSAKESAKEIIDGCDIDIALEEKRNAKSGEAYPSYAPRSWELIMIPNGAYSTTPEQFNSALKNAKTVCRGVIGYELLDDGSYIISNGNCIVHHSLNKEENLIARSRAINRNFTVLNV